MENMDLQSNLAMMEDIEFEKKVDIDDLVLPSKPKESTEIEINDVKQEPLEEEKQDASLELDSDLGKEFKLKMEENILKLCLELDKEKSENSATDFKLKRLLKIRQFVENISEYGSLEKSHEIKPFSCKLCDKSFLQVHEVKEHIKIHNSVLESEDLKSQVKTLETEVEELKVKLKNSQKNEFKQKAKVESKRAIPESENKIFSCNLCPYSNDRKWNLQRHVSRYHEGEIPFKCQHCDKKFKSQVRCNDHEKAIHKPDFEGFKCPQCSEILAYSTCLKRHIKMFHQE